MSSRKSRAGSVSAVRPLLNVLTAEMLSRLASLSDHPDRRFRQAPPLLQVRKSERTCDPQTITPASSSANYEALITSASQAGYSDQRRSQRATAMLRQA